MQDVFVGRQPIMTDNRVYAYELLFRSGEDNLARVMNGDQATSEVICLLWRLARDHRWAKLYFISLTRDFILQINPRIRWRVVMEVLRISLRH
jgi:EAL and modified HD-GYP domain-containing signal transduction protein